MEPVSLSNMEELELTVQQHVINFCKILPTHFEKWKTILADAIKPVVALSNYAEQLRHIEKCNIKYIEGSPSLQENLRFKIFCEIEYEIHLLKELIEQLNKVNHETKNRLTVLERSTTYLNWENNSQLIVGSAIQPPLSRILQDGLNFVLYFSGVLKLVNENFKNLDIRDQRSVNVFRESLNVDLGKSIVTSVLAITQYVNNEKCLV